MNSVKRILVINPNSSTFVTDNIKEVVLTANNPDKTVIDVIDLPDAPLGIETQKHIDSIIPLIENNVCKSNYDAYVIACFSDPGVSNLRKLSDKIIVGIGESAYHEAAKMTEKFGVIAILAESCERQISHIEKLGYQSNLAATVPLNMRVTELKNSNGTESRILNVAEQLLAHGAGVIILGCAGLSHYGSVIARKFNVPVIEPCETATNYVLQRI